MKAMYVYSNAFLEWERKGHESRAALGVCHACESVELLGGFLGLSSRHKCTEKLSVTQLKNFEITFTTPERDLGRHVICSR